MNKRDLINEKIDHFSKVMRDSLPPENLVLFNKNISNLKVKFSLFLRELLFDRCYTKGEYLPISNTIRINKFKIVDAIIHELLHMASTRYVDGKILSGLSIQYKKDNQKTSFGVALTEGYTEILRNRYFDSNNSEEYNYDLQQYFALLIEEIIGKEKMENCYFNADLGSFFTELSKYSSPDDAFNFVVCLDDVTFSDDQLKMEYAFNYLYRYVIKCFLNKEIENNNYLDTKFVKLLNLFPQEFEYRGKVYKVNVQNIFTEEDTIKKKKIFS